MERIQDAESLTQDNIFPFTKLKPAVQTDLLEGNY